MVKSDFVLILKDFEYLKGLTVFKLEFAFFNLFHQILFTLVLEGKFVHFSFHAVSSEDPVFGVGDDSVHVILLFLDTICTKLLNRLPDLLFNINNLLKALPSAILILLSSVKSFYLDYAYGVV